MHRRTELVPFCAFERNEFRSTTVIAIMAVVALVCPVVKAQQPAPPESPSAVAGEPAEVQEEAETPQRATPQTARPAVEAYKRLYYDNDFTYLNDPANDEFYLGDVFKQWPVGPRRRGMLDLGGEYRLRDHHEFNLRGRNLTGQSDDFLLQRTRFYGNLKVDDGLRLYGEALDSATSFQRHTPLASEENGIEALNLFADLRLVDAERGELWGRVGRQELAAAGSGSRRYACSVSCQSARHRTQLLTIGAEFASRSGSRTGRSESRFPSDEAVNFRG